MDIIFCANLWSLHLLQYHEFYYVNYYGYENDVNNYDNVIWSDIDRDIGNFAFGV